MKNANQMSIFSSFFFPLIIIFIAITDAGGTQIIIQNKCKESIWPGILGNNGHATPVEGGFHLGPYERKDVELPERWSGRVWGRKDCCFDQFGKGTCLTGDCGGRVQCKGIGGVPPATIVEMTFGTEKSALHYYDVSLLDGFNVPVTMAPIGGGSTTECGIAGCETDLNVCCPSTLVVERQGKIVGCKSACLAAKSDKYCCRGNYGSRESCKVNVFGLIFKAICPRAYSYAFDDASGLMTCQAPRYLITFCP